MLKTLGSLSIVSRFLCRRFCIVFVTFNAFVVRRKIGFCCLRTDNYHDNRQKNFFSVFVQLFHLFQGEAESRMAESRNRFQETQPISGLNSYLARQSRPNGSPILVNSSPDK